MLTDRPVLRRASGITAYLITFNLLRLSGLLAALAIGLAMLYRRNSTVALVDALPLRPTNIENPDYLLSNEMLSELRCEISLLARGAGP